MTPEQKAHKLTDDELKKLERKIAKIYNQAGKDLEKKLSDYMAQFEKADKSKIKQLEDGKITQKQYDNWRAHEMMLPDQWKIMRETLAQDYTNANKISAGIMDDGAKNIYALNHNYAAYALEHGTNMNLQFTLYDKATVERLLKSDKALLPQPKVDIPKDLRWNKQKIQSAVTQGILQGEPIDKIASRLQQVTDMNKSAAIRNARTATTGAENAGRQDTYDEAVSKGVKMQKEWLATLDGRTRHSHAALDGEHVDTDKKFSNGCRFPGDPQGPPTEVYNCFVGETQIASDSKIVRSYKHTYKGDLIEVKTARGINFTCTPNHPILTPYGWVAAALLHNGDNLVVTFDRNTGSFRRNSNIKHIHSGMKALYNSLHCFGLMSRDSTLRINFHGDIPTTDVEVITKKWLLRNSGNTGVRQSINKFLLKNTNKPLMSQCSFMKHFRSVCKSALRFIGSKCQTLSLLWRSLFHPGIHGFRTVSGRDVGVTQDTVNNLTAKSETLGKVLDGFSGEIAVDKVVSVKIIPSGQTATHVYNLQTQNGYYFVNSSIPQSGTKCNGIFAIAKNCRCTMIAVVDGVEDVEPVYRRDNISGEKIDNMTYSDWENSKKNDITRVEGESHVYKKEDYKSAQKLVQDVTDDMQYENYGFRVQDVDTENLGKKMSHISKNFGDDFGASAEKGEELSGVSALGINNIGQIGSGGYSGKTLYLLGSANKEYGYDAGEIIMKDPVVLAKMKYENGKIELIEKISVEISEDTAKTIIEQTAIEQASESMEEYIKYKVTIIEKYGEENMWRNMTDAEMDLFDNLERKAYKG
jgi:SPP1 gp7 family putative phage head morphogenesis protein